MTGAGRFRAVGGVTLVAALLLGGCSTPDSGTAGQGTAPQNQGAPAGALPEASPAPQAPNVGVSRSVSASPSPANLGDAVIVRGAGWPSQQLVNASICGNNYLNGQVDCDPESGGQTVADLNGEIFFEIVAAEPPKPCPCVVRVSTIADGLGVSAPFEINGVPIADPVQDAPIVRRLDVTASLQGGVTIGSLLGLSAQRELVLTFRNTGTALLVDVPVNVGFGHGTDPTDPVLNPDGSEITLPAVEPGEQGELRIPITVDPVAVGSYRAKASFIGLDSIQVNSQPTPAGTFFVTADTSTYPWGLVVLGWLLLQIPLLGLYKRRPVVVEQRSAATDPAWIDTRPLDAGFAAGLFASPVVDPLAPPPPPGYQVLPGSSPDRTL